MKFHGQPLTTSSEVIVPILRSDGNLYFIVRAVEDPDEFNKLMLPKNAPTEQLPGQDPKPMVTDAYKNLINNSYSFYTSFYVVRSLAQIGKVQDIEDPETKEKKQVKVYEDVVWETVDFTDIQTYPNWEKELINSGLTSGECRRLHNAAMEANSLTDAGVEKAREDFLALPEEN